MTLFLKSPFYPELWALLVFKNQDLFRLGCRRTADTVLPYVLKKMKIKTNNIYLDIYIIYICIIYIYVKIGNFVHQSKVQSEMFW